MQAYLPVEHSHATREDSCVLESRPSVGPVRPFVPPALCTANPIPNSKHLNLFMHLSCANGVAVVSNEIKTNGGTAQDGDKDRGGVERGVGQGWGVGGCRGSVIALGMCRLSGVRCDWTRLGCRLARNLQGRFYMAPSWSTCDPFSCFFFQPSADTLVLLLPAYPSVRACSESDCSAALSRCRVRQWTRLRVAIAI